MARNRKREANGTAWYRKFDDGWYTTIDGKRTRMRDATARTIKGKDMKADAELAIARLKLSIPATHSGGTILVANVADASLEHLKAFATADHIDNGTRTMNDSCSRITKGKNHKRGHSTFPNKYDVPFSLPKFVCDQSI
jgi:hypothetical protein